MPDPANYDSEESFMEACVPMMVDEGKPQDQAVAACLQMWRDKSAPSVDRAWSTLTVKSIDAEQRTIEGIASTPTVDRVGDIVEPLGAKFTLPIPLLHHHKNDQPVGQVIAAKATKDGITIKAKFAQVVEPGTLKDRIDTAWQEVKAGLVRGLSIGFKAIDAEPLDPKDPWGGLRFNSWNWFELSLVTIPANADASITLIKSLDQDNLAASGNVGCLVIHDGPIEAVASPGASGKKKTYVNLHPEHGKMSKTIQEQVEDLENSRAAKAARMADIMQKSMDEGRSTDDAEKEDFDTLQSEVEAIDSDLKRYRQLEKTMQAKAKPVAEIKTAEDGSAARAGMIRVRDPEMPKGIRMGRVARCLGLAQGNRSEALRLAKSMYASDQPTIATLQAAVDYGEVSDQAVMKAAVPAGSTLDPGWAGNLVSASAGESGVVGDFLEYLRPTTIIGKFGTNGVPALRQVPFRTGLVTQTQGGAGYWVGEGLAKGVTKVDFNRRTLLPLKVANIAVVTEELLRESSPSADGLLRDALASALRERMDSDFINPAITATSVRPASITNGVTVTNASGTDAFGSADQIRADVRALMNKFILANILPNAWIMRSTTALALSLMQNPLGQAEFGGITLTGGTFAGLPVVTSEFVPATGSPAGDYVVLLDTNSVWFADEGGIAIDMSREASLQMDDAPVGAAASGSPSGVTALAVTALVSLWQENCVGFRAERTINWARARAAGVQVLAGADWGEGTAP